MQTFVRRLNVIAVLLCFLAQPETAVQAQYPSHAAFGMDTTKPCGMTGCYCMRKHVNWFERPATTNPKVEILVDGKVIAARSASQKDPLPTDVVFPSYGTVYEVRISNPLDLKARQAFHYIGNRRMFDIEVDGLSAMDGKPRSGRQRGYVLNMGGSTTIKGWRIDDDNVNQFVVSRPEDSIAANEGVVSQAGTITVRVYSEKPNASSMQPIYSFAIPAFGSHTSTSRRPPSANNTWGSSQTQPSIQSPGPSPAGPSGLAGTAAGATVGSKVHQVSFDTDSWRVDLLGFKYRVNSTE